MGDETPTCKLPKRLRVETVVAWVHLGLLAGIIALVIVELVILFRRRNTKPSVLGSTVDSSLPGGVSIEAASAEELDQTLDASMQSSMVVLVTADDCPTCLVSEPIFDEWVAQSMRVAAKVRVSTDGIVNDIQARLGAAKLESTPSLLRWTRGGGVDLVWSGKLDMKRLQGAL